MLTTSQPEVLAEEADDEGERQEDRRHHGQLLGDLVEPVGGDREVGVAAAGQQVAVGVDLVGDADRVVVDVAEVVARVGFAGRGFRGCRRCRGRAGRAAASPPGRSSTRSRRSVGDLLQLARRPGGRRSRSSSCSIRSSRSLEHREEGVGEAVEDAVDDELLGARRLRVEPFARFVERRAGAVVRR